MRLSLAAKIFLGFIVLLSVSALLAVISVGEIRAVAEELRALKEGHLALARLAAQLETHQQNRVRDLRRALDEQDPRAQEVVLRIALAYFPNVIRTSVRDAREVCDTQTARARKEGGRSAESRIRFYRGIRQRLDRIEGQHRLVDGLTEQIARRAASKESLADQASRLDDLEVTVRSETYQLDRYINDETDRAARRAAREERNALWRVIILTAVALVIGVLLTVLSARALAPIGRLVHYARAISRGDYEQSIDVRGDFQLSALAEELAQMARSRKDREEELDRQAGELERAYRRVAELKHYHESVVRSLRTAVVVTDRDLVVTSTNPAAEAHWGLVGSRVRGQSLQSLELHSALMESVGPLNRILETGETVYTAQVPMEELLADVTVAPLKSERDDVFGLVVTLEDVTEAVRTKAALIRSERLAAIGRMSAHVTHEIRNPLSSIGLNAELLADLIPATGASEATTSEAKSLCEAIVREVDRLTAITEEYLRFARLPRPELRPEDLGGMLRTIGAFVRRDCEAANVELSVELPTVLPEIHVDADQMRQAILNLVRNAKESMPQGGRLVLGADADDDALSVIVRDSGLGIPPESLDRIFDPFFSTKLTGTGLGLALSQQIVIEHGGELRVRSIPGEGSEFRIVMPRGQAVEIKQVSEHSA